jgi:hypothetical protein
VATSSSPLDDLLLVVSYESHDWGLSVRLGVPSPTATSDLPAHVYLPDYTAYTTALEISDDRYRTATGWQSERVHTPAADVETALTFVVSTLPIVLPRQKEVQTTLRNRNRRRRTR